METKNKMNFAAAQRPAASAISHSALRVLDEKAAATLGKIFGVRDSNGKNEKLPAEQGLDFFDFKPFDNSLLNFRGLELVTNQKIRAKMAPSILFAALQDLGPSNLIEQFSIPVMMVNFNSSGIYVWDGTDYQDVIVVGSVFGLAKVITVERQDKQQVAEFTIDGLTFQLAEDRGILFQFHMEPMSNLTRSYTRTPNGVGGLVIANVDSIVDDVNIVSAMAVGPSTISGVNVVVKIHPLLPTTEAVENFNYAIFNDKMDLLADQVIESLLPNA